MIQQAIKLRQQKKMKLGDAIIAAIIDHLPPKGHQTVRYYGLYSNKTRGQQSLSPDCITNPSLSPENRYPPKSFSFPPRPNNPPVTCGHCGAT